jgi:hypothetical protein
MSKINIKRGRLYKGLPLKNHKGSWEFVGENEVHYVCPELAWKINTLFKQYEILQKLKEALKKYKNLVNIHDDVKITIPLDVYNELLNQ